MNRLELDLAIPSAIACRIVLLDSQDKYGEASLGSAPSLGWDVPAGFSGHLQLALDSAGWPSSASPTDTSGLDRGAILADIQGIAILVGTRPSAPLVVGSMEIDNITWK